MIIQRCCNPKNKDYHYYGGRGIKICERWRDFKNFYKDMGSRPFEKATIGRIHNDGDYCPENCHWETMKQQNRNSNNCNIESKEQANYIRLLYLSGKYSQKKLGEMFEVSNGIICDIVNNKTWI